MFTPINSIQGYISGGGGNSAPTHVTGKYGAFYDTTIQAATLTNTAYAMQYNSLDFANGVQINNNALAQPTRIQVLADGYYNFQFSAQLVKTTGGGGVSTVDIWLRKNNNTDLPWTNSSVTMRNNGDKIIASWNFLVQLLTFDYIEIMFAADTTGITIDSAAAASPHPETPSVILTVWQI